MPLNGCRWDKTWIPRVLRELDSAVVTSALEHFHWPLGRVYIPWDHSMPMYVCHHARKVGKLSSTLPAPSSPITLSSVLMIRHWCGSMQNVDWILWPGNMTWLSLALGAMVSQLRAVMFYITLVLETEAGSDCRQGTSDQAQISAGCCRRGF